YISPELWIVFTIFILVIALYLIYSIVKLKPLKLLVGIVVVFLVAECFIMPGLRNIINNPEMKSISKVREIRELDNVPFYHIDSEPLRIELVYAAHRNILPLSIDSISKKLPCALLTHKKVKEVLPPSLLDKVSIKTIDFYDDNRRPKTNSHYSEDFFYYVTLLRPIEPQKK
ncbi:MAG: phospholipid carrier-dependent glycosyltransferase, partial [Prevotella sp.]|nr:phospholipid carrier-dependent glycosyltransferase [Prevotella sp.]